MPESINEGRHTPTPLPSRWCRDYIWNFSFCSQRPESCFKSQMSPERRGTELLMPEHQEMYFFIQVNYILKTLCYVYSFSPGFPPFSLWPILSIASKIISLKVKLDEFKSFATQEQSGTFQLYWPVQHAQWNKKAKNSKINKLSVAGSSLVVEECQAMNVRSRF